MDSRGSDSTLSLSTSKFRIKTLYFIGIFSKYVNDGEVELLWYASGPAWVTLPGLP